MPKFSNINALTFGIFLLDNKKMNQIHKVEKRIGENYDMSTEYQTNHTADYYINNTKYTVKPFFTDTATKEKIEDKIKRLILQESK